MTIRNQLLACGALLLAACGGHSAGGVPPLGSAEAAVREFMAAVQDSNIARMGRSWGSSSGPAAVTNDPPQWEQRMKVVQYYLRGGTFRVANDAPVTGDSKRRNLQVELTRGDCVKLLPFVAVQSGGGWLVESVDISVAGNPRNPCPAAPATP